MASTRAGTTPSKKAAIAPARLIGGIGGLVFVVTVIAQNLIRAAAPSAGAGTSSVVRYYATHRASTLLLAALFPIGAAALAVFAGALGSRLTGRATRGPALAGIMGITGIFATFTMVEATDVALAGYVHRGHADAAIVSALWITHNAVFGVLLVSIAVALAGLSAAASAAGLLAPAWKAVGGLGALALAICAGASPALLDGSPILMLGLAGFLVWVVFVAAAAVALLRHPAPGHAQELSARTPTHLPQQSTRGATLS
ncbi:MAG TPA: hypothetical protein VFV73_19075 [Streptosporangiaceae bacterium]|nr:hypothetical protein [Streptosporangiaceae bacterium]